MATPQPSAAFTVNGSAVTGAVAVAASSTVTLALVSTFGVRSTTWTVVGTHSSSATAPTIASGTSTSFTMPAGSGQAYLIECTVNGGRDSLGRLDSSLKRRAVVGVLNASGIVPLAIGEKLERSATHGWVESINDAVDAAGVPSTAARTTLANTTSSNAIPVETDIREIGGVVNAKHYGLAEANAAAANDTALAAAFAAALAGSGVLYIPAGAYAVSAALQLTSTSITIFGDGSRSQLQYSGSGALFTRTSPLTYVNSVIRDLRITGTASGTAGIDLTGASNATNLLVENVRVDGFSGVGAAGIVADNLYGSQIRNCMVLDNYDGIRLGVNCIGNTIGPRNFVRGWTRYGIAIIGETLSPTFENNVIENIVDEPVSSTGTAGVFLTFCNVTSVIGNHFEALSNAISIGSTGTSLMNAVERNMFSNGLTTAIETGTAAGDTTIRGNRVFSGSFTDNGARTRFEAQESAPTAAGGSSNTRTGWRVNSGYFSPLGLGFDGDDKALRNAAIGGVQSVSSYTSNGFAATRNTVELSAASTQAVYGTPASTTTIPTGGLLYVTFGNSNVQIWHNRSGDFGAYFFLLDKTADTEFFQGAPGDLMVFVKQSAGWWREVYRYVAANGGPKFATTATDRLALTAYTVATVPSAATYSGQLIRVTDGDAGSPCLAYSNGTDWLRIPLGAAVSTT